MEVNRVLVAFLRRIDIVTFKRALELQRAQNVYSQNNIDIETYSWKGIGELHLCCGFYSPYVRQTVDLLRSVTAHFNQCRVLFVCTNSETPMYTPQLPPEWTICASVEKLEQELREELTPPQRNLLVQRVLPLPQQAQQHLPQQDRQGARGLIFSFFGGERTLLQAITHVMEEHMHDVDPDEIQQAINQSIAMDAPREDIRKRKRKEHAWTRIFKEPVPLREGDEESDNACVVCYANYATIQFVDEAGECDHIVMCDSCAAIIMDDTRKCPVCRAYALTVRRREIKD